MNGRPPSDDELAERLRAIGTTLHAGYADDDRRRQALEHLEAAHALLDGGRPRPRWYEVEDGGAPASGRRELSAFSGSVNSVAPPMRVERGTLADGRPAFLGSVRLDRQREGPPRSVHGGVLAGLFDELLGAAVRLADGGAGMTGRLTVRYRRPTPIDTELLLRAWIHDERTRRVVVRGDCIVPGAGDGRREPITAEAEAVFLRVDFGGLETAMAQRRPDTAPAPAPRSGAEE